MSNNLLKYIKLIEVEEDIKIALYPINKAHLLEPNFMPRVDFLRYKAIKNQEKRLEFIASRFCLHVLFPNYKLTYADRRPVLLAKGHISLSHGRLWAGAIYSPVKRVGLDVEEKREKIMTISHKFIREDERAFMEEDEIYKCQIIWCAKEAMFKLWKHGNVIFKDHLKVHEFKKGKIGCTQGEILKEEHIICDVHYRDLPNSVLVYAVEKSARAV